jgi:glycosyltransferase involved in cell wall biosynthesis
MLARTSTPPSIAFVLPGLGAGGSENIVSQLCNHFATKDWQVTLIAFEEPTALPYYSHHSAVRIIKLGMRPRRRGALAETFAVLSRHKRLRKTLAEVRPDIVVSFLTRTNILTILAARQLCIPMIVSERNNPALQSVGRLWSNLRRWTYPAANGLVTMTSGAMHYFTARMKVRAWVIPNPASPAKTIPCTSNGKTIGAVGRLVPQKGFDLLLDAFAHAAPTTPDWTLSIWGEGPDRQSLETQCAILGIANRVDLPGVTRQPGDWIAQSDIFVLSSRFEGWGIVVGEAMSAGLPVISFDCDFGPAEMIEHDRSGVLVPNGDVLALSAAIATLCQDAEARATMGKQAALRMENFAVGSVLARWEEVITTVIQETRVKESGAKAVA